MTSEKLQAAASQILSFSITAAYERHGANRHPGEASRVLSRIVYTTMDLLPYAVAFGLITDSHLRSPLEIVAYTLLSFGLKALYAQRLNR